MKWYTDIDGISVSEGDHPQIIWNDSYIDYNEFVGVYGESDLLDCSEEEIKLLLTMWEGYEEYEIREFVKGKWEFNVIGISFRFYKNGKGPHKYVRTDFHQFCGTYEDAIEIAHDYMNAEGVHHNRLIIKHKED